MAKKSNKNVMDNNITPKKKDGRGSGSPLREENLLRVDPGDNARYLQKNLVIMNLPEIDKNDLDQVTERINWYFNFMIECDSKPTLAGLAMSLGYSRRDLWAVAYNQPMNGQGYMPKTPPEVSQVIKKAYKIMENMWEDYMQNNKMHPTAGIFIAKNQFGYQDVVEHVVTPNVQADNYSVDDIRKRYQLPEEVEDGK